MKLTRDIRAMRISVTPRGRCFGALVLTLAARAALPATQSAGQSIDELNAKIADAQSQASSLGADLDAKAAQLASARQQAAAAAQREAELTAVLVRGEEREAELAARVDQTQAHLARTRARLHRAIGVLRDRLVAIYQGDMPDATELRHSSSRLVPTRRPLSRASSLRSPAGSSRSRRPNRSRPRRPSRPSRAGSATMRSRRRS